MTALLAFIIHLLNFFESNDSMMYKYSMIWQKFGKWAQPFRNDLIIILSANGTFRPTLLMYQHLISRKIAYHGFD